MQVLNLDELAAKANRSVVLDGSSHAVQEMSVEGFIEYTRMAKELDEQTRKAAKAAELAGESIPENAVQESVTMSVATVRLAMPTIPEARLRQLNLVQLMTLIRFINGELDKDTSDGIAPIAEGEPAKKS